MRNVSGPIRKTFSASICQSSPLLIGTQLEDFFCAKALYAGLPSTEALSEGAFHVHIDLSPGTLPLIRDDATRNIAADLQPMLADYRIRHADKVRDSKFDMPGLRSEIRMLARILSSPIVEAPTLHAELVKLLKQYQSDATAAATFNVESVVVEALKMESFDTRTNQLVYVGRLAVRANEILKERGSREMLTPKAVGLIVRNFGFVAKRNSTGYAIQITDDVRRTIDDLFRKFLAPVFDDFVAEFGSGAESSGTKSPGAGRTDTLGVPPA